jgi:hypothetical protein
MSKYCGVLNVGSVKGGGTVSSQSVRGNQVVSSFEVPVAIEYEMHIGDTYFKKMRCCEQAMAPFVAQNNGNDVCIYTFKQIPRTNVMLAIMSQDGPSYKMAAGRMYLTIFAQIFIALLLSIPLIFIPFIGWALIPVLLFFTGKYVYGLYTSWQDMANSG